MTAALLSLLLLFEPAVCFSPQGGCASKITAEIARAKKSVRIAGYVFTSRTIAKALVAAKEKKLEVEVVVDDTNKADSRSATAFLKENGVPVYFDSKHAIFHNKVIIIDGKRILTGSYNWTASAELKNAENVLFLTNTKLAAEYEKDFQKHKEHSTQ
jgi:phosphatidylserine/phosphatidylglycerophosphate/cardiolipin synthase-like enzyme